MKLNDDTALTNPSEDRLGFAPFSSAVASAIANLEASQGFVFAVNGAWGSGKTTAVNFIIHDLSELKADLDIIQFNPWWFSGQEDLTSAFFDEVTAVIGKTLGDSAEDALKSFSRRLSGLRSGISFAMSLVPIVKDLPDGARDAMLEALGLGAEEISTPKSIIELKQDVADALEKAQQATLVVIDDIDRLTAEEQLLIFKLVKSVADLPNIIYLLVFDDKLAETALRDRPEFRDGAYLEKIVQAPFTLPKPSANLLEKYFIDQLNQVIGETSPADNYRWYQAWQKVIRPKLTTPRSVNRLINGIRSAWPSIGNDVDLIDLISIETLRVFDKPTYSLIWEYSDWLTSLPSFSNSKKEREMFEEISTRLNETGKEYSLSSLEILFPRFDAAGKKYGGAVSNSNEEKRICDPEHFRTYFQFGVDTDTYSEANWIECLELLQENRSLDAYFRKFVSTPRQDGHPKSISMMEAMQKKAASLDPVIATQLVSNLFIYGDILLSEEHNSRRAFEPHADIVLGWTINELLEAIPSIEQVDVIQCSFERAESIDVIGYHLFTYGKAHGRYYEEGDESNNYKSVVPAATIDVLEEIWMRKFRGHLDDLSIFNTPHFRRSILYRWRTIEGDDVVKAWIAELLSNEDHFFKALHLITYRNWSSEVGEYPSVPRDFIGKFVDIEQLKERAETVLTEDSLEDDAKTVVDDFLKGLDTNSDGSRRR